MIWVETPTAKDNHLYFITETLHGIGLKLYQVIYIHKYAGHGSPCLFGISKNSQAYSKRCRDIYRVLAKAVIRLYHRVYTFTMALMSNAITCANNWAFPVGSFEGIVLQCIPGCIIPG